jgi:hypothetical protein
VVSTIRLTPACRATGRFFGIIPVLAIQGAGYVVAGLAMLAWLKDGAGPPKSWGDRDDADIPGDGEQALVVADALP